MDRTPYRLTTLGSAYDALGPLPVSVLLDNLRSLYNVGAFFRTADAGGVVLYELLRKCRERAGG